MRSIILAAAIAAALPVTAQAQSFKALNDLIVVPVNRSAFEVIEARGEGPRGIWCAAADYAERRLGVRSGRVYIAEGRGASRTVQGRKAVTFTTDASSLSRGPFQSTSLSTSNVGVGVNIGHASQFCNDRFDRERIRFRVNK